MASVCDHRKFVLEICRLIEDRPRLRYASSRLRLIAAIVAWMKRSVIRVSGCAMVWPPWFSAQFPRTNLPRICGTASVARHRVVVKIQINHSSLISFMIGFLRKEIL